MDVCTQLELSPDSAVTKLPTGGGEGMATGPGDVVRAVGDGEGEEAGEGAVGGDIMLPAGVVVGGRGGGMLGVAEGILGPAGGDMLGGGGAEGVKG